MTPTERFWSRVDRSAGPDACWPWTGAVFSATGYGQATTIRDLPCSPASASTAAHRQAWLLTNGDPGSHTSPTGRLLTNRIMHRCPGGANRLCCNPAHLVVGTDRDNAADRERDGTTVRGSSVRVAVLSEVDVEDALAEHARGVSAYALAKRYGVSRSTMASALHGETWGHVAPHLSRRQRQAPHARRVA